MPEPKGTDPIDTRELPYLLGHVLRTAKCVTRNDVRHYGRDQFARISGCGRIRLRQLDDLVGGVWAVVPVEYEPEIFCYNCRFFQPDEVECRRHAPRARVEADLKRDEKVFFAEESDDPGWNKAAWPFVDARDWCGEFDRSGETPADGWLVQGEAHPTDKSKSEGDR